MQDRASVGSTVPLGKCIIMLGKRAFPRRCRKEVPARVYTGRQAAANGPGRLNALVNIMFPPPSDPLGSPGAPIYRTILPEDNYDQGVWEEAPICWELLNTSVHLWTPQEIVLVRTALEYWKDGVGLFLGEWSDPICAGRPVDVQLAWEISATVFKAHGDANNDGLSLDTSNSVGYYVPPAIGVLEETYKDRADPPHALLAHHYVQAERLQDALGHFLPALQDAAAGYRNQEALPSTEAACYQLLRKARCWMRARWRKPLAFTPIRQPSCTPF